MRKNILAIVILAATLVNVTLVAILLFTLNPYVKRANELITRVCEVIDLELESPSTGDKDIVPVEDRDIYLIMEEDTISLATSEDGKNWIALVTATLTLNKKHEDYTKISALIESNIPNIKDIIQKEVSKYQKEGAQIPEYQEDISKKVLEEIKKIFDDSKCVYDAKVSIPLFSPQK